MRPETYREFTETMNESLRADGIDPEQVDIRLQGSSAQFYSGAHKNFPTASDLDDQPDAKARLEEWMGDRPEAEWPARVPFDGKYRLAMLDEDRRPEQPSDYDVQFSSDAMVARAQEVWKAADHREERLFIHPKYDFVDRRTVQVAFPALLEWSRRWESVLGREIVPALFPSEGPPNKSAVGIGLSTHFRDTDWILNSPRRA